MKIVAEGEFDQDNKEIRIEVEFRPDTSPEHDVILSILSRNPQSYFEFVSVNDVLRGQFRIKRQVSEIEAPILRKRSRKVDTEGAVESEA